MQEDEEETEVNEEEITSWDERFLWQYRIHITTDHLKQHLEGSVSTENGKLNLGHGVIQVVPVKHGSMRIK